MERMFREKESGLGRVGIVKLTVSPQVGRFNGCRLLNNKLDRFEGAFLS